MLGHFLLLGSKSYWTLLKDLLIGLGASGSNV